MHAASTEGDREGFVEANGVHTYFEVRGSGEPLVLLHGGLCAIETLDGLRRTLAARYQVFMPERRGHGRTPDVDGPFSYEVFAEDTIAFMEAVGLSSAHLVGFSDGATVALLVALRRPELARSLVHIGQPVNPKGIPDQFREILQLDRMPSGMLPPVLRELYEGLTPDGGDHWDAIIDKQWQMLRSEPDIGFDALGSVAVPTLVLVAEHDMVTIAHSEEMRDALPDATLVVIPDANHGAPMEKPDVVGGAVLDFLAQKG